MGNKTHFLQKLFVLLLFLPGAAFAETPEQKALDAIQLQYEGISTYEADFTQKSYVKMMNQTQSVEGKVKIKKPGKMKWVYGAPDTQILISDGINLWLYIPEEEQATKVPVENIYSSNTPALFLAGKGKLTESFNVESVSDNGQSIHVSLVPKSTEQSLERLTLRADKKNYQITGSTVYDKLGNKTEIRFSRIRINREIPNEQFQLKTPPGVEILDYTQTP
ncbi:MAG: outer membrane lipoprotein chaperone LolA [Nitrospinaceae bacterium]|mgnify:CR=1 FL=1|nr:outer membrane lipoprotein chaperone LolA [Nitrospina sp.]MBT5376846.1 outer membrane lipoprotein chaperone LolA [Nitrospinaceae bacterium]MBT5869309.1 outer membrane lipoprotein chaperone LolA [Nitrospinaceae bacterium]